MFEKWRIKEHMEVADSSGQHIGTVDDVDGDQVKLTRSDSDDGQHHYFDIDQVDRIEDNRVYLRSGAPLGTDAGSRAGVQAGAETFPQQSRDATDFSTAGETRPTIDDAPFGTSGKGTGMGGSGGV